MDAIDVGYSAMVLATAYTGLRFSELRALGVDRFNALWRTMRVSVSLVERYADDSGLVFSAPTGGPIRRSNFRRRIWLPAVEASVGQPCTFHDPRHPHAALLMAQGEHPKVI